MLCPICHTANLEDDLNCRNCGTDLTVSSQSLVTIHNRWPAVLHNPQIPRIAASVGAVAVGVGLELLRRSLVARAAQPARLPQPASNTQPTFNRLKDVLFPQNVKTYALPKNYEIQETLVYMQRVIRRRD